MTYKLLLHQIQKDQDSPSARSQTTLLTNLDWRQVELLKPHNHSAVVGRAKRFETTTSDSFLHQGGFGLNCLITQRCSWYYI